MLNVCMQAGVCWVLKMNFMHFSHMHLEMTYSKTQKCATPWIKFGSEKVTMVIEIRIQHS